MTTASYTDIIGKVKDKIVGLHLTTIPDANVVVAKLPWARDMLMPGVRIAYEKDPIKPWTNEAYKVDCGIWVLYARVSNQDITGSLDVPNQWREAIVALFQSRAVIADFAGIGGAYNVRVEPATPLWEAGFEAQHDVGALRVIVTCTRPR